LLFGGGTLFFSPFHRSARPWRPVCWSQQALADDDETAEEVKELRREVEDMRHLPEQLSELGERVDFLERLVAKQREAERLPPVR